MSKNAMNLPTETKIFRECEVLSNYDDSMGMRIKVKLHPEDTDCQTIEDLPYCFPLMPKIFQVLPKKGERVLVTTSTLDNTKSRRWYIGPIISQPYFMENDPFWLSSRALLDDGDNIVKPLKDPRLNPDNNGTLPDTEDVVINGRNNADVILKDSEVNIRAGFKKHPELQDSLQFNKESLAYLQMKYKRLYDNRNVAFDSSINIVADRINLLSRISKNQFKLTDPENNQLISDEEQRNILDNAHPLPFGDELIEYLKQLIEVIRTHTHPASMDPPTFTTPQLDVLNKDLNSMLSYAVRIN